MAVKTAQAVINGQTYTLTYNNNTKKYEATITAPGKSSFNLDGGYYGALVKAVDNAGNESQVDDKDAAQGSALRLIVREKAAPVITITSPAAGASIINNKPSITFTVTDNDSGVNPATVKLVIDSGTAITGNALTKTTITGGYQYTYTPATALSDGSHTIKVDASDNDGNAATQKTAEFKIDTVPPTLSISSPANGLETNSASVPVAGTTNDITSSPVTLTVNGNGVTVNADGTFSTTVSLSEGSNTIKVVATDGAGKSTTVTRTVIKDTAPPVISDITLTPNPVDAGKTFVLSVTITD